MIKVRCGTGSGTSSLKPLYKALNPQINKNIKRLIVSISTPSFESNDFFYSS